MEITCQQKFRMKLDELLALEELTDEQAALITNYYKYMPVIISNSPMNILCRRIEKLNEHISKRSKIDEFDYNILKYSDTEYNQNEYKLVEKQVKQYLSARRLAAISNSDDNDDKIDFSAMYEQAEKDLLNVLPDVRKTVNILVDYFYKDNPSRSRDILWGVFGKNIVHNLVNETVSVPLPCPDGDIEYLGERYKETQIKV